MKLIVMVTGNGGPIPNAAVKVMSSSDTDAEHMTDEKGKVSILLGGRGVARVRVIAAKYESALKEIQLGEGVQRLEVELEALPLPDPPDH